MTLSVIVFALTYVLLSARRLRVVGLDRPAAALLGAALTVALGVLGPAEAIAAIDGQTLLLLFGVMGLGGFLALDGFFDAADGHLVAAARTPTRLMGLVVWGAGLMGALITNDAVCLLGAPLVVGLVRAHRLPPLPFLLALATGANTGSVATLVGNPQNMLCGILGKLEFAPYLLRMGPLALGCLALNHGILHLFFREELRGASLTPPAAVAPLSTRARVDLGVVLLTSGVYLMGANLAWTAAGAFALLLLVHRRDARELWPRIDWPLLLFFAGLFVVAAGLSRGGAPALFFERLPLGDGGRGPLSALRASLLFLLGSNVVSNVPFILVVKDHLASVGDERLAWELLAMASTFAGNLTLLGSAANVIVAEAARDLGGIGFWAHLRVGAPVALVTTVIGALYVGWLGP